MRITPIAILLMTVVGPPVALGDVPGTRQVRFAARGEPGVVLEGVLHVPGREARVPGVVMCHPDPRMGGSADDAVVMAVWRVAVERGMAVLRFNFRGVGESTGEYDGKAEVNDVLGALDFLREQPEIDPEQTHVAGYSFGAAMALLAALQDDESLAYAGVSLPYSGLAHEREFLGAASELRKRAFIVIGDEDQYGDADAIRQLLPEETTQVTVLPGVAHFYRATGAVGKMADAVVGFLAGIGPD